MTGLFIYEPVGRSECLKKGGFFAGPYGHLVQKKKRKKAKEKKALQKRNVHEATSSGVFVAFPRDAAVEEGTQIFAVGLTLYILRISSHLSVLHSLCVTLHLINY